MSELNNPPLIGDIEAENVAVIGTLNGDLVMNSTTISQFEKTRRKRWRPLGRFDYPTTELEYDVVNRIPGHLVAQLHRTFREEGYTEFTSTIATGPLESSMSGESIEADGKELAGFVLRSHQSRYAGALLNAVKILWGASPEGKAFQDGLNSDLLYLSENWVLTCGPWYKNNLWPYHFVYDPDGFRISISPHKEFSSDPADYPYKVGNTSELLTLLCALCKVNLCEADWQTVKNSYGLTKLFSDVLNRDLSWDNVRVNVDNPEEWDYLNPAVDKELAKHLAK